MNLGFLIAVCPTCPACPSPIGDDLLVLTLGVCIGMLTGYIIREYLAGRL
jgi:hypothetical protein